MQCGQVTAVGCIVQCTMYQKQGDLLMVQDVIPHAVWPDLQYDRVLPYTRYHEQGDLLLFQDVMSHAVWPDGRV